MNFIKITTEGSVYPYSFWQLRQDNPHVSFSASPSAEDLAAFGVYEVEYTSHPSCNPRLERVEEVRPVKGEDGAWRQAWKVRPATDQEISQYDMQNPPIPNWSQFKEIAMNSETLNNILALAYQSAPVAAGALAPALLRCENGDCRDFAISWMAICSAVRVQAEVVMGFVAVARQCDLPQHFISALESHVST